MIQRIFENQLDLAGAAAADASVLIRLAIAARGCARIVASTGLSQREFLARLVGSPGIDWQRVELFHLDEYIGLSPDHPASFNRYIRQHIIDRIGPGLKQAYLLDGMANPQQMCAAAGAAISSGPVDLAFVGIGENGHLAFNDPPADFTTTEPFLVVNLDQRCREQQVGEGWFRSLEDVPRRAITMSVRQILKAESILCIAPEARKAEAVKLCFEGDISPMAPASALRLHPNTTVFLDRDSARLVQNNPAL